MSKNSDYVLQTMLQEYQRRIAAGMAPEAARKFDFSFPGLRDVARELMADGFADANILGEVFVFEATFLRLSAEEAARLAAEEQARNIRADQEAQKIADETKLAENERKNRQNNYLVALFGAAIGCMFTLLVERFDELLAAIKDFLH